MDKIAFLFTGQGAQFVGMGKGLYDEFDIARKTYEEANDILGFNLAKLCFEGNLGELARAENAQPALLAASVVAYRVFMKEIGIAPDYCAGHSLGEYSALACTGALKFSDALKIVRKRGKLTQKIIDYDIGAMTIIDAVNKEIVEEQCKKVSDNDKYCIINCYNSPSQVAIAGHKEAVEAVESIMLDMDAKVTPLITSAPFHSSLMQPIVMDLEEELRKYNCNRFKYPVVSNYNALPYDNPEKVIEMLLLQMTNPVQWQATMRFLMDQGVTIAIEMGPQNVLCNLVNSNSQGIEAFCYGSKEDRLSLTGFFYSDGRVKEQIPSVITRCLAAAASTPNACWDIEEYRQGVTESYRKIQQIQDYIEREGILPSKKQMQEALNLLRTIFITKKIPYEEQNEWFNEIFDEISEHEEFADLKSV